MSEPTQGPQGTAQPSERVEVKEDLWLPITQPLRDVIETSEAIDWFRIEGGIIGVDPRTPIYISGPYVFFDADGDAGRQALHIEAIHGFKYH